MRKQPRFVESWHWFHGCAKIAIYRRYRDKSSSKIKKRQYFHSFSTMIKKNQVLIHECSKRGNILWKNPPKCISACYRRESNMQGCLDFPSLVDLTIYVMALMKKVS